MSNKYMTNIKPYLAKVEAWKADGVRECNIAKRLGVSGGMFYKYKKEYIELQEVLTRATQTLADDIELSLYKRAKGYDYEEVKTTYEGDLAYKKEIYKKHMPADSKCLSIALGQLKAEQYRAIELAKLELEKQKVEILRQKSLNEVDLDVINENINNIAELLNTPVKPRRVK